MSAFWRTWLTIWCGFVIVFGLVLADGAFAATDGPTRFLLAILNPEANTVFDQTHRFAIALVGALTMGWGFVLLVVFAAAHRAVYPADIWRPLTGAILGWYVVDSSLSIATGFWPNAVSNTLLLVGYLIPLLRTGAMTR